MLSVKRRSDFHRRERKNGNVILRSGRHRSDPVKSAPFSNSRPYPWSNRILIGSVLGIACLTLFPFDFGFNIRMQGHALTGALLLGSSPKPTGFLNSLLNVLLFVPLGFGIASQVRKRNRSWALAGTLALLGGALASYTVEFLQFYIPERNSGWDDIFTNSAGSFMGFLAFVLWGKLVHRRLFQDEKAFENWVSLRRITLILVIFVACCLAMSVSLQRATALSNWDADSLLTIAGDGRGSHSWRGKIFQLEIWDRPISNQEARTLTAVDQTGQTILPSPKPIASYDFLASPFQDHEHFLPDLSPVSSIATSISIATATSQQALSTDEIAELGSQIPVQALTRRLKTTNQFAVNVVCTPATGDQAADIVLLGNISERPNFELSQQGTALFFSLQTPLSDKRSFLDWQMPNVFAAGEKRNILVSYDGSDLWVHVNGIRSPRPYRLGPGVALAHQFFRVKAGELGGYMVVFNSLFFVPIGLLLGIAIRKIKPLKPPGASLLILGLFLPPPVLEFFLTRTSGRPFSPGQLALSLSLALVGFVLSNADRECWLP
jgi:glycopeptide antibiotics resistance protein